MVYFPFFADCVIQTLIELDLHLGDLLFLSLVTEQETEAVYIPSSIKTSQSQTLLTP